MQMIKSNKGRIKIGAFNTDNRKLFFLGSLCTILCLSVVKMQKYYIIPLNSNPAKEMCSMLCKYYAQAINS